MNSAGQENNLFALETTASLLLWEKSFFRCWISLKFVSHSIAGRYGNEFEFSTLHTVVNGFLVEVDIWLRRELIFVEHHLVEGFLVAEWESEGEIGRLVLSVGKVVVELKHELGAVFILVEPVADFLN